VLTASLPGGFVPTYQDEPDGSLAQLLELADQWASPSGGLRTLAHRRQFCRHGKLLGRFVFSMARKLETDQAEIGRCIVACQNWNPTSGLPSRHPMIQIDCRADAIVRLDTDFPTALLQNRLQSSSTRWEGIMIAVAAGKSHLRYTPAHDMRKVFNGSAGIVTRMSRRSVLRAFVRVLQSQA